MKRLVRGLASAVALTAVLGFAEASAQDAPASDRVEDIRLDPQAHAGEIRTLEGVVERLVSRDGGGSPAFYLEDDFGHQILVIPFADAPARGERIRARGVVSIDTSGDPLLTVFEEGGLVGVGTERAPTEGDAAGPAPVPSQADASVDADPSTGGPGLLLWTTLIAAVVLVAVFAYGRGRAARGPDIITGEMVKPKKEVDIATSALWPESEREFDGRTMRFTRPDPTVRLMAARLEVIGGGDTGEEVHFVGVPGEPIEMMFGRSPGEGPRTVHLKQKTVSRTHAIVRHRHGEWMLENLSMTNPTVLNGEVMGVKERLLTDGDRIEMGEVVFRFVE